MTFVQLFWAELAKCVLFRVIERRHNFTDAETDPFHVEYEPLDSRNKVRPTPSPFDLLILVKKTPKRHEFLVEVALCYTIQFYLSQFFKLFSYRCYLL